MRVTTFILARAGSKGLPGKNIVDFMGRPLIAHTIQHALDCPEIDDVIVSTDGEQIAEVSRDAGAEVMMRPYELASDTAMPKDAVLFHLEQMREQRREPEVVVLLQPTSPLRAPSDITHCIHAITLEGYDSAATFQQSPSSPYRAWVNDQYGLRPFINGFDPWQPRQSLPRTFALNGAVYAVRKDLLLSNPTNSWLLGKSKMVEMPSERSIDIDVLLDLKIAETVANAFRNME